MKAALKEELAQVRELMTNVSADTTVPRNIRAIVAAAQDKLAAELDTPELGVAIGSAIYMLEDISSDINMPAHTRTEIWTVISSLESVKEKLK